MGGLNEGTWPPDVGYDPWMSRPMRKKFKLPSPEYRVGLSAHDFAQLACTKEVFLTRSLRTNGTPTVPSRFLLQLEAVLNASGLSDKDRDAMAPTEPWKAWAHTLDRPDLCSPCARPQPCPPVELRPKALSVTEITTWLRNPYAIYAKHILKLKKLDDLDAELDASDRGTMIHEALERFIKAYPENLPDDAEAKLLAIGQEIFAQDKGDPRVRAFWEAGFSKIASWFVAKDRERREEGIVSVLAEISGKLEINGLTLTGRADRVEKYRDGSLVLIDYKTGSVPTKKEVKAGLEPQLPLLALLAAQKGFKELAETNVRSCEYWVLKSGAADSDDKVYDKDLPALMAEAETGLKDLIAAFKDPTTPYEATPRLRFSPRHDDYAHLSRLAEWGRAEEQS